MNNKIRLNLNTLIDNAVNSPVESDLSDIGLLLLSDPTHIRRRIVFNRKNASLVRTPDYVISHIQMQSDYNVLRERVKHTTDVLSIVRRYNIKTAVDYDLAVIFQDCNLIKDGIADCLKKTVYSLIGV